MLTWGLIGAGPFAHTVARAIKESPGSRLLAVTGRNLEKTKAFQREYGIPNLHLALDDMLSDPQIDIVHVAAPTIAHHEICLRAAKAKKHVLCEKSLAVDAQTAREIAKAATDNGVFLMEGLMYLSHPTIQRFIEIIKSGAIGKVRSVLGQYAAPIASVANPTSGGTILDLGCYPVSLLQLAIQTAFGNAAFEDRRAISATGVTASDGTTILDTVLSVRFGCGVLASVQSSSTFGFSSTFVVFGDKGSIEFVTNPWLPVAGQNIMRLHHYGDEVEEIVVNATDDAYSCQVRVAEQMIKAGQIVAIRPSPTPNDSIEIMSLLTEWRSLALASSDLNNFA